VRTDGRTTVDERDASRANVRRPARAQRARDCFSLNPRRGTHSPIVTHILNHERSMSPRVMTRTRGHRDLPLIALSDRTLRAFDRTMVEPSMPIVYHRHDPSHTRADGHEKRVRRQPPTSHGARRPTLDAPTHDAPTHDARTTARETRRCISFRSHACRARRSRARGTVSRRPSVGRTDRIPRRWRRLGSIGALGGRRATDGRVDANARDRGTHARFEKARARSRSRAVDRRVRRRAGARGGGRRIGGGRFRVTSFDSKGKVS